MMRPSYLAEMRIHVDEDGTLSHRNGADLLAEVEALRAVLARCRDFTADELAVREGSFLCDGPIDPDAAHYVIDARQLLVEINEAMGVAPEAAT